MTTMIKKIDIISAAKIAAILAAIIGFIYGLFISLIAAVFQSLFGSISALAPASASLPGSLPFSGTGISSLIGVLGMFAIIILPIVFAIAGFIIAAIGALIYNLTSSWIGGIEVEIEEKK